MTHNLTNAGRTFLDRFVAPSGLGAKKEEAVIHVSNVLSGAATFYERLRYSIDYRETHLLRRHAFERILRRRLENTGLTEEMANLFVVELVQAGYLKNDAVPEAVVPVVNDIIKKYAAIIATISKSPVRDKEKLEDWFLGVASAELEQFLVPSHGDKALVELMTTVVERDQPLAPWRLAKELENTLTFIAAYRALFAFDPATLHHLLLLRRLPNWHEVKASEIFDIFPELLEHHRAISTALQHPAGERLWRILKSRAMVFHALFDITKKHGDNPNAVLSDPARLANEVEEVCRGYYRGSRRRLYSSAARATLYIFITKIVVAIGLEAPLERLLFGEIRPIPLAINLIFPPVLLIGLAVLTRFPGETNTKACLDFLSVILWGGDRRIVPEVRITRRSLAAETGLGVFYILTFFLIFGFIAYGLMRIDFTWISVALFLFFLSVVSFFAVRIRQPVRDLYVLRNRDNIFGILINFLSLPILKVGRWISMTSARFNVFLFFFDYFLEAPIKAVLLASEDVLGFFREKREDIV